MSGSLNRVTLIGNLGADPEVRTTAEGRRIVRFSVATTERWKDASGARQERTPAPPRCRTVDAREPLGKIGCGLPVVLNKQDLTAHFARELRIFFE